MPPIGVLEGISAFLTAPNVGGVHGWALPPITGRIWSGGAYASNAFALNTDTFNLPIGLEQHAMRGVDLDIARITAVANKVQVPSWGALPCVYLGLPR